MKQPRQQRLRALRRLVDRSLEALVALLMAALVLNVLWQVTTRFVLQRPSAVTEEIARYGLVWLGLFGATLAYRRNLHPSLREALMTLAGRHGDALGSVLLRVADACVALFGAALLCVGGLLLTGLTAELGQRSAALGLQLAWVYAVLPVTGALLVFYALCALLLGRDVPTGPGA